jgi:hypothetical protein
MEEDLFFPGTGRQLDYSGPPSRPPSPPAPSAGTSVSKNPSELTVEQIIELAEASWDMSASLGVPGAGFISAASLSMNSAKAIPAPAPKAPEPPPAMEDLLPEDPRDHSLLEAIYDGMHAERVISLRPLAALEESLPRHFKGLHRFTMPSLWSHATSRRTHARAYRYIGRSETSGSRSSGSR